MLAKLKYLKEEEKALQDIKNMITEQATRLKQEECYLRSLMRGSNQGFPDQLSSLTSHEAISQQAALHVVDDNSVNKVPLEDLQVQSSSKQQLYTTDSNHVEEEEDDDEEEVEDGDCRGSQEEDGINMELMTLMQQMQESGPYDDDNF